MNEEQTRLLQQGTEEEPAIDWFGERLVVDGDYGLRSQWWHYISQLSRTERLIIRVALGHVHAGVKDNGSNRGPVVDDRFMAPAGAWAIGKPWCIGAQSSVLHEAGANWPQHHVSTAGMLKWAAQQKRILPEPRVACAYGFLYPPDVAAAKGMDPGAGHGGIVIAAPPESNWVAVADGNVGDKYTVGLRAKAPLTFVRTVNSMALPNVPPVLPSRLPRLDGWRDR